MLTLRRFGYIVSLLILSFSSSLFGQAVNGTLLGTVTDSTGAIVSDAKITATQTGTGVTRETVSNDSGNYTMPDLIPGTYSVKAVKQGFKQVTRENITVLTNNTERVDIDLTVGSMTETVEVTTAPPQLQTDRADISTAISSTQIANLPLSSGNSFQSLLNTVPGMAPVVFNNSQFFNANNDLSTNANGQSSYVNLYQIEGIDDDQRTGIHIILVPSAAAIANVDITTNNFEAEFGRAVGTVVNVTLKSGTNNFHGSVFQNMENNGVNARPYFQTGRNGRLVYNYTGGSIGGPILKEKLFIFGDVLRVSDHELANATTTVPYYNVTGNVLSLAGYKGQVYDPNTGDTADCQGGPNPNLCGTDGVHANTNGRTAFAGNLIPLSNPGINPISLKVIQAIDALARSPQTNLNSASYLSGATGNNFSANLPFHKDMWSYDIKSDYNIGTNDHLSGRFSWQHINTFQAPLFGSFLGGPANGGFEATGIATAYSTGANYTHTFNAHLVTEARFGVAHLRNSATQTDYGVNDAKTLGFGSNGPNGTNANPTTSGQVAFNVPNFANPFIGYSASLPWLRAESNIDLANNWTKIIGNHQIKGGADVRRVRDDLLQGNNNAAAGNFYFNENATSAPNATSFNGGATGQANDFASVLFAVPNQVGQDTNSTFPAYRQTWLFFFASDKWQATSKLTLDLGLRWELYPPATPRKPGGFVNYNPTNNQLVVAGLNGNASNLGMQSDYKNFAPRLGAAYRVNENLVVRAGFGVSYVPFVDNNYAYNYPIKTSSSYNNPATFGQAVNPGAGVVNFVTGVPATPTAAFSSNGTLTETVANGLLGLANLYIPLNFKNPYVSSWNVVVQQALPHDSSIQLAYVANHGTRISIEQNINIPSIYGQGGSYDPLNITFQKTSSVTQFMYGSSTNYQSLQVQFNRRYHNGFGFTTAYTWGKASGYVTGAQVGGLFYGFSAPNPHLNYSTLDFDRTNNLSTTLSYELPAGKGHKYLNSGIGAFTLGGWKLSAILQGVSGLPFSVTANSSTPGVTQTANLTAPFRVSHGHAGVIGTGSPTWFDPTSFVAPSCAVYSTTNPVPCALGTSGRNQFRGPGYFSDNLSIFKTFSIHENWQLDARFDAFNMTNTPAFANPTNSITSGNFGKITSILSSGAGIVNGVGGPRALQASVKLKF